MERLLAPLKALLIFGLALHIHHHVHGPPFDYGALALASAASWLGLPGPGEPVLIAAGVLAAKHKLDIVSVVAVAWLAATAGGAVGWVIGRAGGRTILSRPGPLHTLRLNALARGDEVFARAPVIAIILTPSWIAGIHRVGTATYMITNAVTAVIWAGGIGIGAYFAGPVVIDAVQDIGVVASAGLVLLVTATIAVEIVRRRRKARTAAAQDT